MKIPHCPVIYSHVGNVSDYQTIGLLLDYTAKNPEPKAFLEPDGQVPDQPDYSLRMRPAERV